MHAPAVGSTVRAPPKQQGQGARAGEEKAEQRRSGDGEDRAGTVGSLQIVARTQPCHMEERGGSGESLVAKEGPGGGGWQHGTADEKAEEASQDTGGEGSVTGSSETTIASSVTANLEKLEKRQAGWGCGRSGVALPVATAGMSLGRLGWEAGSEAGSSVGGAPGGSSEAGSLVSGAGGSVAGSEGVKAKDEKEMPRQGNAGVELGKLRVDEEGGRRFSNSWLEDSSYHPGTRRTDLLRKGSSPRSQEMGEHLRDMRIIRNFAVVDSQGLLRDLQDLPKRASSLFLLGTMEQPRDKPGSSSGDGPCTDENVRIEIRNWILDLCSPGEGQGLWVESVSRSGGSTHRGKWYKLQQPTQERYSHAFSPLRVKTQCVLSIVNGVSGFGDSKPKDLWDRLATHTRPSFAELQRNVKFVLEHVRGWLGDSSPLMLAGLKRLRHPYRTDLPQWQDWHPSHGRYPYGSGKGKGSLASYYQDDVKAMFEGYDSRAGSDADAESMTGTDTLSVASLDSAGSVSQQEGFESGNGTDSEVASATSSTGFPVYNDRMNSSRYRAGSVSNNSASEEEASMADRGEASSGGVALGDVSVHRDLNCNNIEESKRASKSPASSDNDCFERPRGHLPAPDAAVRSKLDAEASTHILEMLSFSIDIEKGGIPAVKAEAFTRKFLRRDLPIAARAKAVELLGRSCNSALFCLVRCGGFPVMYGWLGDVWERLKDYKSLRCGVPRWETLGGRRYCEALLGVMSRLPMTVDMLRETDVGRVVKKMKRLAEKHRLDSLLVSTQRLYSHLHDVVTRDVQAYDDSDGAGDSSSGRRSVYWRAQQRQGQGQGSKLSTTGTGGAPLLGGIQQPYRWVGVSVRRGGDFSESGSESGSSISQHSGTLGRRHRARTLIALEGPPTDPRLGPGNSPTDPRLAPGPAAAQNDAAAPLSPCARRLKRVIEASELISGWPLDSPSRSVKPYPASSGSERELPLDAGGPEVAPASPSHSQIKSTDPLQSFGPPPSSELGSWRATQGARQAPRIPRRQRGLLKLIPRSQGGANGHRAVSALPKIPSFGESSVRVTWADMCGQRLFDMHYIEPGYRRSDFSFPGHIGLGSARRDMSKKEEKLLSADDHARALLGRSCPRGVLRGGGLRDNSSASGDSEGSNMSDSENSLTGSTPLSDHFTAPRDAEDSPRSPRARLSRDAHNGDEWRYSGDVPGGAPVLSLSDPPGGLDFLSRKDGKKPPSADSAESDMESQSARSEEGGELDRQKRMFQPGETRGIEQTRLADSRKRGVAFSGVSYHSPASSPSHKRPRTQPKACEPSAGASWDSNDSVSRWPRRDHQGRQLRQLGKAGSKVAGKKSGRASKSERKVASSESHDAGRYDVPEGYSPDSSVADDLSDLSSDDDMDARASITSDDTQSNWSQRGSKPSTSRSHGRALGLSAVDLSAVEQAQPSFKRSPNEIASDVSTFDITSEKEALSSICQSDEERSDASSMPGPDSGQ